MNRAAWPVFVLVAVLLPCATASAQEDEDHGYALGSFYVDPDVELALRATHLSGVPLPALPGPTGIDPRTAGLGQGSWLSSWLRLGGEVWPVPSQTAYLHVVAQLDVLDGVVAGDVTHGVSHAADPRDARDFYSHVDPRWLYAELVTPRVVARLGQMGSHWGLGLLANDGTHEPPFGDHRFGDIVDRAMVIVAPFGNRAPLFVAAAVDLVFDDITARLLDGDRAMQGVLAIQYQPADYQLGLYGVYRHQTNDLGDRLDVLATDLFARWQGRIGRARAVAAMEAALVSGSTTLTRTRDRPEQDVLQGLGAAQLGLEADAVRTDLEIGYATGDSNGDDGFVRRATMDPDHRIGLILFPEVLSGFTARAAEWGSSPELVARPARGIDALPTNGGVSGAGYLFQHATLTSLDPLELRLGALLAWSSAPTVDPYRQRAHSENVSWRGADARHPGSRFLGLELDAQALLRWQAGVVRGDFRLEGGILLPGGAFDDAAGQSMDPVWLARLGATLRL